MCFCLLLILQTLHSHGWWTAPYCTKFSSGFAGWLPRLERRCPVWLHHLPAPWSKRHASQPPGLLPEVTAPAAHPVETGHTNSRKSLWASQQNQKFRGDVHILPIGSHGCKQVGARKPWSSYSWLPRNFLPNGGPYFFHLPKLWLRNLGGDLVDLLDIRLDLLTLTRPFREWNFFQRITIINVFIRAMTIGQGDRAELWI